MGNDNKLLLSAYFIVLSPSGEKSATDAVAFLSWKKHIVINKEVNKCPSMQLASFDILKFSLVARPKGHK